MIINYLQQYCVGSAIHTLSIECNYKHLQDNNSSVCVCVCVGGASIQVKSIVQYRNKTRLYGCGRTRESQLCKYKVTDIFFFFFLEEDLA